MKEKFYKNTQIRFLCFFLLVCQVFGANVNAVEVKAPATFTYNELTTLYDQEKLSSSLEEKLNQLLTTPFVQNSYENPSPESFLQSPKLGEFLRVAHWNIERGLEYEAIETVFGDEAKFRELLNAENSPLDEDEKRSALEQAALLRSADVIVLNEVDWGMKRTDYRNIAADLAAKLKMNYAFGVQFVELSPVHFDEEAADSIGAENKFADVVKLDRTLYKGLHGTAILSRFPLENVRLVPYQTQAYDWYKKEKREVSLLEKGKRGIAEKIFLEKTLREVRRGGRMTLFADIVSPKFPNERVTIAATHLENRTESKNRVRQLKELLALVKNINHPVVVTGDMNTSSSDLTPTSLRREIFKRFGKPGYWIRKGVGYALGFGLFEDTALEALTLWHNHSDPTARHIPILMPNSEHKFFSTLKDFRFADGGAFDFRGDENRSYNGREKTLANSNERGGKGFVNTFQVTRPIKFIGKYKLDWIFVKPANLKKPTDENASYRFAPHFGRTLEEVNQVIKNRISDHRPLAVDLPLSEPRL